jgi:hypothetical protein
MGHALEPVATCTILRAHPRLTFRQGPYSYEIVRQGEASIYTVTDGRETISEPVIYAFGLGEAGQTYVLKHRGTYYESRVSFFNDTQALDLTIGHERSLPASLDEAVGHVMTPVDAQACFGCHTTGAVSAARLQLDHMVPGVTCETCHGPGAEHVAAVQKGKPDSPRVFNPGRLTSGNLADFCGACHRSWMQVTMMHLRGVVNVRFQPYRLTLSKCYDPDDRRIGCIACHDPHQNVQKDLAAYDARCLACHRSSPPSKVAKVNTPAPKPSCVSAQEPKAPACRVARRLCVTCHMPKYSLPGAHFKFSDHYIRVVRAH